jgi:hypothetical protein
MIMKKETKEEKSMFKMSVKIRRALVIIILFILSIFTFACTDIYGKERDTNNINIEICPDDQQEIEKLFPHEEIRLKMIEETSRYLANQTKGKVDKNLATYLVDNALEHNIDLCFMLSQTKQETLFGTAGAGKSRKSLFGVIKKRYSNYDDAIDDYCKLLKKYYLGKGKTEQDLLRRYVTHKGSRYASDPNYEASLRKGYNLIKSTTNLANLQTKYVNEYKNYLVEISVSDTTLLFDTTTT